MMILSIRTLSIMTLSIVKHGVVTLSIMTHSISATVSITQSAVCGIKPANL